MTKYLRANFFFFLWLPPLLFLLLFYFYPLVSIFHISFLRDEGGVAAQILEALSSHSVNRVIRFTFLQAILSTAITLLIGIPGAYVLAHYEFRGKSLIRALSGIAFVLPSLVVATAFSSLLGPRGWVNIFLMNSFNLESPPVHFMNSFAAILTAHVFYNTTIVLRMVGDFWSHLDPRIEQAAQSLGANKFQTLTRVTIPILLPVIITAALLVFIFNFTSFGVILVLGGPRFATIEVEIFYQTVSLFNLPLAATLSIFQLVCTLGLTILYTNFSRRLTRPLSLRPQKITQKRLNSWQSKLFAGFVITILLILILAPLLALSVRSFTRLDPGLAQLSTISKGFTLDFYRELTVNRKSSLFYAAPSTAILVSLSFAIATVIISLFLGLSASWALVRNRNSLFNRWVDPILLLPLGTSAVTLGLGFIVALNRPPLDLRASILLIPLAHTLVAFPFVVRSLSPSLQSIQPRLRQAASSLGASPLQVIRQVDLPLVGRALIVAAVFAFTISLGEFGATALIARPEYPTIPIMIYRYLSQPGALNYGRSLALSTILMFVTGAGILVIERFRIAEVGEF